MESFFRSLPDDLSFIDDNYYTKVECSETATNCTSGWVGGDFEDWVEDNDTWHPDEWHGEGINCKITR